MKNALIIDDEESILSLVSIWVSRNNYNVYTANNMEELYLSLNELEKKKENLSLVLCDTNLADKFNPFYLGPDLINEVRRQYKDIFSNSKVIGISGIPLNKGVWRAQSDYFLDKPLIRQELVDLL